MMKKILIAVACIFICVILMSFGRESENIIEEKEIDVDLTQLSSTMVYAQVFDMLVSPDTYQGKTIKMRGNFTQYKAPEGSPVLNPGQRYFACVITDALACCSQGIDFELRGNPSFPEDYPKLGSEITVVGTFQQIDKNGYSYTCITNASLEE